MTIFNPPIMTLAADIATPVDFIQLGNKEYRIDVQFAAGASGTVEPRQTTHPSIATHSCKNPFTGNALSLTGSDSFVIAGPCFVGFVVSSLTGTVRVSANATD